MADASCRTRSVPRPENPHFGKILFAGKYTSSFFYYVVGALARCAGSFMVSTRAERPLGPLPLPASYRQLGKDQSNDGRTEGGGGGGGKNCIEDPNTGATDKTGRSSSLALKGLQRWQHVPIGLINASSGSGGGGCLGGGGVGRDRRYEEECLPATPARHHLLESATWFTGHEVPRRESPCSMKRSQRTRNRSVPLGLTSIVWLGAEVGTGGADVSGNSIFAPTQVGIRGLRIAHKHCEETKIQLKALDD